MVPLRCAWGPVEVGRSSHRHLTDHAVEADLILPLAYVVEWLLRAAVAHADPRCVVDLTDIRVLKGLVLDGCAQGRTYELLVGVRTVESTAGGGRMTLELVERSTGRRHYSCVARLTDRAELRAPVETPTPTSLAAAAAPEYGAGVLFHGPSFHVVESAALVPTGVIASLHGLAHQGWPNEDWVTAPAVVDGALQTALLWTAHRLGRASRSTSDGRIVVHPGPSNGPHHATLVGGRATVHRAVSDVRVCDEAVKAVEAVEAVEAVVDLYDIETHVLPDRPAGRQPVCRESASVRRRTPTSCLFGWKPARGSPRFLVAHVLVRTTLSRFCQVPPAAWTFGQNGHGQPETTNEDAPRGLRFNLSRTPSTVALLVNADADACVDLEDGGRVTDPLVVARAAFSSVEQRELRALPRDQQESRVDDAWTLKKAFAMATARGLTLPCPGLLVLREGRVDDLRLPPARPVELRRVVLA